MMSLMKILSNVTAGTIVSGKWQKQSYRIVRRLGMGANGVVYLVEYQGDITR